MQQKLNQPERSYAELEQQLEQAEKITELALAELLAFRQSQLWGHDAATLSILRIQHQLQFILQHARRNNSQFALLFVQLDHAKSYHEMGDTQLIRQISELTLSRLSAAVRECDSISQLADDQFLVLITDVSRILDTVLVAEKLIRQLAIPHQLPLPASALSASIGISRFPEDGGDAVILLERATAAMQRAQSRGGQQFSLLR
ncbi:GGDEF domain-containing protein [Alkalimonas amylolytica]|uniref:Diguanylate cyclase (GGDEF) domain-containing protein n=1 Tax=Alkalimonas amylolytica TaxID=152573 RepID=A0A1H4BGZ8_ALKAM|nr:GGDEF domain-containing protein [Alkalimonas amylolytica]SEA47411.1 diguanylate cyclase (GGDEF) domain-containing protein [Alkalimonas amylolytica]